MFTCKYTTVCCLLCFPTNIANILMSHLLPMILLWCLGVVSSAQTLPRNFARTSSTPSELSNRVSAEVPKRTSLNKVLSWVQFTLTMSLSFSLPISSSDEMQLDRLMKSLQAFGFVENEKNSLLTIFELYSLSIDILLLPCCKFVQPFCMIIFRYKHECHPCCSVHVYWWWST